MLNLEYKVGALVWEVNLAQRKNPGSDGKGIGLSRLLWEYGANYIDALVLQDIVVISTYVWDVGILFRSEVVFPTPSHVWLV